MTNKRIHLASSAALPFALSFALPFALSVALSIALPLGYQTAMAADSPSAEVRAPEPLAKDQSFVDSIKLETHGFVSFGYIQSAHNNWLGPTTDGTSEFWEAAANVIARPMDRLRVGAQLFARDLVDYDNGKVTVDWAYADYRFDDAIGVQVGRFKLPLGLYNESLDVDAARTEIFLPPSVYDLQSRDFQVSTDGAKIYGMIDMSGGGLLEYATYAGAKPYDLDAGYASYVAKIIGVDRLTRLDLNYLAGAMLHWSTPIDGFAVRLSGAHLNGVVIEASTPSGGVQFHAEFYLGYFSLLYELPQVTLATEYRLVYGRGDVELGGIPMPSLVDNTEGAYVSATWHASSWWETYAAIEGSWADAQHRAEKYAYTGVLALNVMPLPNWSMKAEIRGVRGVMGISPADNPDGISDQWAVFALKTTVDF
jgi:hypothetical protein